MSIFALDTSGEVALSLADGVPFGVAGGYTWDDLTPFQQGYVEALFAVPATWTEGRCLTVLSEWADFSDLSPEALATILRDCEARYTGWVLHPNNAAVRSDDKTEGGRFWRDRQAGNCRWSAFPPLTVSLGNDGKVHLSAQPQGSDQ